LDVDGFVDLFTEIVARGFAQKRAFAQNIENLPRISKKIDWEEREDSAFLLTLKRVGIESGP